MPLDTLIKVISFPRLQRRYHRLIMIYIIVLCQARMAMEPITTAGKRMIASSSALIQTAKPLAINPKDPPTWQLLANHSKNVSDSIKELIASIR